MPTLDVLAWLSVADERDFRVKRTQFKQSDSSCTINKRSDILESMNIYDTKGLISGRKRLYTYTEGAFMPAGAKDCLTCREICRDILTTARAHGLFRWWDYPSGELSRLMAHLLMISEDLLKFISDSQ